MLCLAHGELQILGIVTGVVRVTDTGKHTLHLQRRALTGRASCPKRLHHRQSESEKH